MKHTSLRGIANKASTDKTHRFRNLSGMLTAGFLLWCWQFINRRATPGVNKRELKLDLSSDCDRFQTGLIFSQQHRPSCADITNQTGFKKAVEGNAP